jgi:peptide chain release factor subunit 1
MGHFKRHPFERLIVGGPREVVTDFEQKLHHYLHERLAGRIEVDVERSTPDQVLHAARPLIEQLEQQREREVIERLPERGARGLDDVLPPLNERRVELLILDEQFGGVIGVQCLECGWVGLEGERCPADGSELVQLDDLTEAMIELSVQQAADVLAVRHERAALEAYGGAAALLRF